MAPVLKQLLARYPQQLRLVYREFPLNDIHPNALHAALAAVCAAEQGKFWELHDALFADQSALGDQAVMKTAERVGIKLQPFASCLLSPKTYETVRDDIRAGNEAGVNGTPGLFVNGRFYDGFMPLETITAVVEDELQRRSAVAGSVTRR
jgi:protein-disulfide isomerase